MRAAVAQGRVQHRLQDVMSASNSYALAASLVAYVDATYGRARTEQLLHAPSQPALLDALGLTENDLLARWRTYVLIF